MSMWEDIEEFHMQFGIPQTVTPSVKENEKMMEFRIMFLREELQEFEMAVEAGHTVEAFDALLDLVYVAIGTAYLCNFPWDKGWDVVHAANMMKRKVKNEDESKRQSEYDVIKPDGWVAPDLALHAWLLFHQYELQMKKFQRLNEIHEHVEDEICEL